MTNNMKTTRMHKLMIALVGLLMTAATSFPMYSTVKADGSARFESDELAQMLTAAVPEQTIPPIACDETKQGAVEQNDSTTSSGLKYDIYGFTTQQPNQAYTVTAQASFPLDAELFFNDSQQQQFVLVAAAIGGRNQQLKLSGTLATPGQYVIVFFTRPENLGSYTVKLECKACGATTPGGNNACTGGSNFQNAIQLAYDQSLSCELGANDAQFTDQNGGAHFAKIMTLPAQAGSTRITVNSQAFTPIVLVIDNQGRILQQGQSPFSATFQAGQVYIAIAAGETQRGGAFTVQVAKGSGGPFGLF
jgi:hypothetical protein